MLKRFNYVKIRDTLRIQSLGKFIFQIIEFDYIVVGIDLKLMKIPDVILISDQKEIVKNSDFFFIFIYLFFILRCKH